jgi:hypothetical protein
MTAWEEYLDKPTPKRASRVQAISYAAPAMDPGQQERDLMMLEAQVLSRDIEAVRLAFRLRQTADGHFVEMLDVMLGRLIRIDASLFLREVLRAGVPAQLLDSLVGNFGPEYVDRTEAQAYEAAQRIAALSNVTDSKLKAVRKRCIALLKN